MSSFKGIVHKIGLKDADVSKLAHHIFTSYDYVEAVSEVVFFLLTRKMSMGINKARYPGELRLLYEHGTICRVIICHNQQKLVSYRLPFDVVSKDGGLLFFINGKSLDCERISKIKTINYHLKEHKRKKPKYGTELPPNIIDAVYELGNDDDFEISDDDFSIYNIIERAEPGYVRYDYDPKSANGQIHPLYHLDINYDIHTSYKCGLYKRLTTDDFERIFMEHERKLYLHEYNVNNDVYDKNNPKKIKRNKRKSFHKI